MDVKSIYPEKLKGEEQTDIFAVAGIDALKFDALLARGPQPKSTGSWKSVLFYCLLGSFLLTGIALVLFLNFGPYTKHPSPTEEIAFGTFIDTIAVEGNIHPREKEIVTTPLSGPIHEIWVAEGDFVEEGQALFSVEVTGTNAGGSWTSYEEITAPIAGQVASLNLTTGKSFAQQNSASSPACVVADLSNMKVILNVNEVDIAYLATGQKAQLSFDALPDLTIDATVFHVSTLANEIAGLAAGGIIVTYPVELALEESDSQIKPGMSVSAQIVVTELPDVLLVNTFAIQELNGIPVVNVQDANGLSQPVEVRLLASSPAQAAIEPIVKGALAKGDRIVTGADQESNEGDGWGLFAVRSRFSG